MPPFLGTQCTNGPQLRAVRDGVKSSSVTDSKRWLACGLENLEKSSLSTSFKSLAIKTQLVVTPSLKCVTSRLGGQFLDYNLGRFINGRFSFTEFLSSFPYLKGIYLFMIWEEGGSLFKIASRTDVLKSKPIKHEHQGIGKANLESLNPKDFIDFSVWSLSFSFAAIHHFSSRWEMELDALGTGCANKE
ncbi:hypothetical protein Tco_1318338 [Tanacetum coccineum]